MDGKGYILDFYAWAVLRLDGEDMTNWGYLEQKEVLRDLIPPKLRIHYTPHRFDLEEFFQETKEQDREGIIIKREDKAYTHGRSYRWKKVKNWRHEVFDVVGYTPGNGRRDGFFGSLVVAQNDDFRGCVGTGFNDYQLKKLTGQLMDLPKNSKPFDIGEDYRPVQPKLKIQAKYYQTTESGVMRFPVFEKVVS